MATRDGWRYGTYRAQPSAVIDFKSFCPTSHPLPKRRCYKLHVFFPTLILCIGIRAARWPPPHLRFCSPSQFSYSPSVFTSGLVDDFPAHRHFCSPSQFSPHPHSLEDVRISIEGRPSLISPYSFLQPISIVSNTLMLEVEVMQGRSVMPLVCFCSSSQNCRESCKPHFSFHAPDLEGQSFMLALRFLHSHLCSSCHSLHC